METKSNHVLVGSVVIVLTVLLFAFIMWLAGFNASAGQAYDIFFRSGVSGLAKGSQVQFAGVPVGTVNAIRLMPDSPEFVRVRITVDEEVPILMGTQATLESQGFTGVSIIQLTGATKDAPPIDDPGPFGVPVIPTKPGALGQLLSSAPQLLDRLSVLTARVNELLDSKNQQSITNILANVDRISGAIASRDKDISASITEARATLTAAREAANAISVLAASTDTLINTEGKPMIADLRQAVARAESSLAAVARMTEATEPAVRMLATDTLPEVNRLVLDLRGVAASMGAVAAKLDEDPAAALVGGRQLPDYQPETR